MRDFRLESQKVDVNWQKDLRQVMSTQGRFAGCGTKKDKLLNPIVVNLHLQNLQANLRDRPKHLRFRTRVDQLLAGTTTRKEIDRSAVHIDT